MPLYIPWLTETIKKRGVRYLLHHYLGQFFLEKLTLEQLSVDIYEGKGSIKDLALDVDGLNDELDFVPFRFLEGCSIGQISVEVPWSSLATEACRVELDGAKFVCRLKTSADAAKAHCTESTLLSRSLMTSSMQMAEEIVTTENDDEYESPESSIFKPHNVHDHHQDSSIHDSSQTDTRRKKKNANQMFEGLEMFAQLIDSVLRRTKLTSRNTLFQIQPHKSSACDSDIEDVDETDAESDTESEEFSEPIAKSEVDSDTTESSDDGVHKKERPKNQSEKTVEFFIKFFRCEEIVDQTSANDDISMHQQQDGASSTENDHSGLPKFALPSSITKLLTLEDVEMRIDGIPVSNLVGKHTITIKFNGHKREISIFSGSPLLAVIGHKQLETFFNVFDSGKENDLDSNCSSSDKDQKLMNAEDYAKIENQLLESASIGGTLTRQSKRTGTSNHPSESGNIISNNSPYYISSHGSAGGSVGGRRWVETGQIGGGDFGHSRRGSEYGTTTNFSDDYHSTPTNTIHHEAQQQPASKAVNEPTLDNIEAFSCELKLPGIWLCILRDGEKLPPLIKPYADSINSFQSINKYIDEHIKVPHIRCLALKVTLDITATAGMNLYLADLDISEHLVGDESRVSPMMRLLHNDSASQATIPINISRYKASIKNGKDITIELLTSTRMLLDPTIIDRIVYDYKLIKLDPGTNNSNVKGDGEDEDDETIDVPDVRKKRTRKDSSGSTSSKLTRRKPLRASGTSGNSCRPIAKHPTVGGGSGLDVSLTIRGERFKIELLCPIPDLTPEAHLKPTQLRPQSFIFDFRNINLTLQSDKLNVISSELSAYVKTQPKQSDNKAVRFIEATSKGQDKIMLIVEPSPSNLDNAFTSDIERALSESTLYDSIYVSQASESRIPTSPFQTKRKLVRPTSQQQKQHSFSRESAATDCDHEKILTPGDRQHLLDYLNQTLASTKLSLQLHLPICEIEFEDKEQLDLIYNRFGNDFVFWQPKAFSQRKQNISQSSSHYLNVLNEEKSFSRKSSSRDSRKHNDKFKHPNTGLNDSDQMASESDEEDDCKSEVSYHSMGHRTNYSANKRYESPLGSDSSCYDNQVTCKILVDELFVKFNHQSCAAALKQEISAHNLLLGIIIDVDKKPNTLLSMVADYLELSNDMSTTVLEGNFFAEKTSIISLTADIKRPNKMLKDIKLAIQLRDALFNDFKSETYSRFWQSINVTDEPIMGYEAPQILVELHVDILSTSLMLIKDGARPSLVSIDELYLTSMVMQQTSQVMIRLLADEVSLYMKRDRQGLEIMKNYICLIDSGLIDLDVKFGADDGRLEFSVINNVITVRVCQDSLSALCKLFNVLIRSNNDGPSSKQANQGGQDNRTYLNFDEEQADKQQEEQNIDGHLDGRQRDGRNLLEDAMNDYAECSSVKLSDETSEDPDHEEHQNEMDAMKSDASSQNGSTPPPAMHHEALGDDYGPDASDDERERARLRPNSSSNNTCLLDESNPMLGDLFSQPLVPTNLTGGMARQSSSEEKEEEDNDDDDDNEQSNLDASQALSGSMTAQQRAMEESDFFVIGDDDVGAGIISDKNRQHEPAVRKLIDGPINIIDNYFKMTKPRTLPEMLANSLERYVLEEMTLVVNLFGGHDFDDPDEDYENSETGAEDELSTASEAGERATADTATSGSESRSKSRPGSIGAASQLDDAVESLENHHNSLLAANTSQHRCRAGSVASSSAQQTAGGGVATKQQRLGVDSSGSGSLKRRSHRKPVSEASAASGDGSSNRADGLLEQRVRFGEGAVNLWESLDLMSSPDFLGVARQRPSQPPISLDSKQAGGTWRQNSVCIQLILSKVKLLFEVADINNVGNSVATAIDAASTRPSTTMAASSDQASCSATIANRADSRIQLESNDMNRAASGHVQAHPAPQTSPISWRFMLFVQDIEVKDKIAASDINKMLYEYCTESMPKRSTQFLTVKNIATINQSDGCEECDLRVSLKPMRLNIDQDTLLFLIDFFTTFSKSLARQQSLYTTAAAPTTTTTNVPNNPASSARPASSGEASACSRIVKKHGAGGTTAGTSDLAQTAAAAAAVSVTAASSQMSQHVGNRNNNKKPVSNSNSSKLIDVRAGQANGQANLGSASSISESDQMAAGEESSGSHNDQSDCDSDDGHTGQKPSQWHDHHQAAGIAGDHQKRANVSTTSPHYSSNSSTISSSSYSSSSTTTTSDNSSSEASSSLTVPSSRSANSGTTTKEPDNGHNSRNNKIANSNLGPKRNASGEEEEATSSHHKRALDVENESQWHKGRGDDEALDQDGRQCDENTQSKQHRRSKSGHSNDSLNTITHHAASGQVAGQQPIYIKSFTFSPDVPIRIDYHAKHWDFEQGALAGILMGLAHLDHSELVLRRVQAKHGMRGLDRVLLFALNSWLSDIKRNQLPSILGGVGPMHSVIQLFQGMRDLIWMPIDHYRKDGRLVRGLQRGASSFSSSTAMAAINLVNRFISIVQCTAQIAHDIVTPPSMSGPGGQLAVAGRASTGLASSGGSSRHRRLKTTAATTSSALSLTTKLQVGALSSGGAQSSLSSGSSTGAASKRRFHHNHKAASLASAANRLGAGSSQQQHDRSNQPRNFCEGVAVGFSIIKEGFNDTARNVTVGMQAEDMRSAVGEIVRQIPSTLLNPIISATEGAQSVLVGIRNQIAPEARREDQEKWKGRVRGK